MRAIDGFLIDRVFQPLADRLARWVSCYGIAAFLLTGFMLYHVAFYVYREEMVGLCLTALWLPGLTWRAYDLDRNPPLGVLPAERITRYASRCGNLLLILPITVLELCASSSLFETINQVGWLILIPAECFMACRANPPAQRRTFARDVVGSEA